MHSRVHLLSFFVTTGVLLGVACNDPVSIALPGTLPPGQLSGGDDDGEAGVSTDAGPTDDAETDSGPTSDAALDAGPDVDASDAGDGGDGCAATPPDDATTVYVATSGNTAAACGTRMAPCKTVALGIARAVQEGKANVAIAPGVYVERIALHAGVGLRGGWDVEDSAWSRSCTPNIDAVVLRAPAAEPITLEARDLGGTATVSTLRIEGKAQADVAPGESIYGVFTTGDSTTVRFEDVHVEVGNAGAGLDGAEGLAADDAEGLCPADTGVDGTSGLPGNGAPSGAFSGFGANGYTPVDGTSGFTATPGNAGQAGALGACVACVECDAMCGALPSAPACGAAGESGCGGLPGGAGGGARGGGSTVGVFVWNAHVELATSSVRVGNGGRGGNGGTGGNGGHGSVGTAGTAPLACVTACEPIADAETCLVTTEVGAAGTEGGRGGNGGVGGSGGGGAGGSAYALYQGGLGLITTRTTTLAHGSAGAGGGPLVAAGAAGVAGDRFP